MLYVATEIAPKPVKSIIRKSNQLSNSIAYCHIHFERAKLSLFNSIVSFPWESDFLNKRRCKQKHPVFFLKC
jgi:hypothetical protein